MKSNMRSRIQFNFQAIVLWTVYSCVICAANAAQITQTKGVVKPKATPKTEKADKKAPELVIQTGTGGSIENVAISPDGKTIATGDFNGAIRLWDKDSGQLMRLLENHQNNLRRLDFSADGKTLFSSDIWGQVLSWNLTTGTSQVVVNINAIRTPSFAPDQKTIVINSRDKLQFFDRSGKLIRSLPALNSNANIAISPDGSEILAGWWEKLQLVDAQTGSVKREFMSEGARVNSIEYSPDGKQFAVARQAEYPNGIVEIRDAKSGQLAGSLNSENLSYAITYAPNGQSIAIGADIYSVPDLKPLGSMRRYRTEYVNDNVFSGDGKTLLVSSDDTFRLLNAADGKVLRKWEGVQSRPLSAAYSADGTRFALGLDAGGASCCVESQALQPSTLFCEYRRNAQFGGIFTRKQTLGHSTSV